MHELWQNIARSWIGFVSPESSFLLSSFAAGMDDDLLVAAEMLDAVFDRTFPFRCRLDLEAAPYHFVNGLGASGVGADDVLVCSWYSPEAPLRVVHVELYAALF